METKKKNMNNIFVYNNVTKAKKLQSLNYP